jgi:hypothetical protein
LLPVGKVGEHDPVTTNLPERRHIKRRVHDACFITSQPMPMTAANLPTQNRVSPYLLTGKRKTQNIRTAQKKKQPQELKNALAHACMCLSVEQHLCVEMTSGSEHNTTARLDSLPQVLMGDREAPMNFFIRHQTFAVQDNVRF